MARRLAFFGLACLAAALAVGLSTARLAAADNCSSPGDCEETGGYNAIIAVVGGIAAVAAAAAAAAATADDGGGGDESGGDESEGGGEPPGELSILQVSEDRIEVSRQDDGKFTLTGWHSGPDGLQRVDMTLHLEVPADAWRWLEIDPLDSTGEMEVTIKLKEPAEGEDPPADGTEIVLTASGTWNDETVTQDVTAVIKRSYDVIVVGGGLSGLVTARRLDAAGKSVLILEAADYLGGRMLSRPVAGGACVDLGGQWVGTESQDRMVALAGEFGVTLRDSPHDGSTVFVWGENPPALYDGDFPPFDPDQPQPPGLWPGEYATAVAVWDAIEAMDVGPEPWTTGAAWDSTPLSTWLDTVAPWPIGRFARFVVTLMARIGGSGAFEPSDVSVLHMAFTQSISPQREKPEEKLFNGCAGQFPGLIQRAFSKKIEVILKAPVTSIVQDPDKGCTVSGDAGEFKSSQVVVAMPPSCAAQIAFGGDPAVSQERIAFGQNAPMGRLMKIHVIYADSWWRKRTPPLSGAAVGDMPTVEFIADSGDGGGVPGILTCFLTTGRLAELSDPFKRKEAVLDDFVRAFGPEARDKVIDYVEKDWPAHAPIYGAFTMVPRPGVWTAFGQFLRQPVGRIHWAGTEVATRWSGYFDGAVRAGEAAADAALSALASEEDAASATAGSPDG